MTRLVFLDTETTGLDPDRHEIWEVAAIIDGQERVWQLPVDLGRADPMALKIGRWYERRGHEVDGPVADSALSGLDSLDNTGSRRIVPASRLGEWALWFANLTDGAHLVGAVVSFDEERLRRLLRRLGACPTWHYHLVDVEALAAGASSLAPPWDSEALSREVGVEPDAFDRHTALGDARWAKAIYEAVVGK